MRRIVSQGTAPELAVRRLIHAMGYRFRLHRKDLPGKPDLVFAGPRKIVEVRGCFWHGHPGCIDSHIPKTRRSYWEPKLARNKERDRRNARLLRAAGWRLLVVWACQTDGRKKERTVERLRRFLEKP